MNCSTPGLPSITDSWSIPKVMSILKKRDVAIQSLQCLFKTFSSKEFLQQLLQLICLQICSLLLISQSLTSAISMCCHHAFQRGKWRWAVFKRCSISKNPLRYLPFQGKLTLRTKIFILGTHHELLQAFPRVPYLGSCSQFTLIAKEMVSGMK